MVDGVVEKGDDENIVVPEAATTRVNERKIEERGTGNCWSRDGKLSCK